MSVAIAQRFTELYNSLLIAGAERSVARQNSARKFEPADLAYMMATASRLALISSIDSPESALAGHYAYEVAVRVPLLGTNFALQMASMSELILSRLGNFPARRLLRERLDLKYLSQDPYLQIEEIVRESENRYVIGEEVILLTDFQVRLLRSLSDKQYVSVSAPTSAGKSFTLELELIRRLRQPGHFTCVFLVPTRALIRQVSFDLLDEIKRNALDAAVMTAPSVPEERVGPDRKLIYVLTQERFAALLGASESSFTMHLILVDEAQEISKPERGQTLERVLRIALARNPDAKLFFSSPLRSNPEYLLHLFSDPTGDSENFIEYQAPVTQNMIALRRISGKPRKTEAFVLTNGNEYPLGEVNLPFEFRKSCLGNVAYYFTDSADTSIIFCNRPAAADSVAIQVYENIADQTIDPDLLEFADFLEQEVHRLYRLPKFIRKGVAFHYSNIPQIIRGRIEELAKAKKLQFICCTSTLLQGMNMPAKNIFVENPKGGTGKEMEPGDFWNLVGRAGRLNHEFTGNVFCVYSKKWDTDFFSKDRLVPIESAFEVAVERRTTELAFFSEEPSVSSEFGEVWAEQAIAQIYADFVTTGTRLQDRNGDGTYQAAALRVDQFCSMFRNSRQTLSDEYYKHNLYVHPSRLAARGVSRFSAKR